MYVYTGPLYAVGEVHAKTPLIKTFVPIVKEAEVIKMPFYVTYDKYGMVQEVFTVPEDTQWSVNIKKGIATVIQLPVDKIPVKKYVKPTVLSIVENSVYGQINVTYDVETVDGHIVVTKTPDYAKIEHKPYYVFSNIEVEKVHNDWTIWNASYPESKYVMSTDKEGAKVFKVQTENIKTIQPSVSEGQVQYVSTQQTLTFVKDVVPSGVMDFSKFMVCSNSFQ